MILVEVLIYPFNDSLIGRAFLADTFEEAENYAAIAHAILNEMEEIKAIKSFDLDIRRIRR